MSNRFNLDLLAQKWHGAVTGRLKNILLSPRRSFALSTFVCYSPATWHFSTPYSPGRSSFFRCCFRYLSSYSRRGHLWGVHSGQTISPRVSTLVADLRKHSSVRPSRLVYCLRCPLWLISLLDRANRAHPHFCEVSNALGSVAL